jgi:exosortase/archaeosortase family protein
MSDTLTPVVPDDQQLNPVHRVSRFYVNAQAQWALAAPKTRTTIQMAAFIAIVVVAYNYSLVTLWQLAGLNTPLAYCSLVPLIALALAAVHSHPARPEPSIHDRQADYIVGLPLMGAALFVNWFLPSKLSIMFWVWRIDLLTLPFFVAGAIAVIFGVRVLWRQKLAVGFLILAWPYPYTTVLLGVLNQFTNATLFGMDHIVKVLHVATPIGGSGNAVFAVVHNGHRFTLSVVSACSGVSSVVGFFLVGAAFAAVIRGPWVRKVLWLIGGMLLLWIINLGRITLIFWTGQHFGEHVAIDVLHPFIGLLTFSIGVGIMILCINPMGLSIGITEGRRAASAKTTGNGESPIPRPSSLAVPRVFLAVAVVLILGLLVGFSNAGLQSYNLVADVSGSTKLISFIDGPVTPIGWISRYQTTFRWAVPLFGENSTWNRYYLDPRTGGDLHAQTDVVADVIDSPDLQSFSAFGIEQCYQFHGYTLSNLADVNLGGGITGQSLAYDSQQYGTWSIVYWIVPVKSGLSTYYERVVLYVQDRHGGVITKATQGDQTGIRSLAGSLDPTNPHELALLQNRDFLVSYARELIHNQAVRSSVIATRTTAA